MKKTYKIIIYLIFSTFLINCSTNTEIIKTGSVSKNDNIFREAANNKSFKNEQKKRISIKAGLHTIFFAIPDDDYYIEFPLTVIKGRTNVLDFKPVYRHSRLHTSSFQKGISHYEVYLNRKLMDLEYPRVSHY